ncbi:MAG TPA: hypothetical protein VH640_09955 [Bryobacteraceae bacterium]|jgi:hypothetical protein
MPRRVAYAAGVFAAIVLIWPAFGQQDYVTRFDAYAGYALLDAPSIGLLQNGVAAQAGFRPNTWLSVGLDYTYAQGDLTITPGLLTKALQQRLAGGLAQLAAAGQLPPGYQLRVPAFSRTQTATAGAELVFRHFAHETLFLRPVFAGAIYETANLRPRDAIAAAIVTQIAHSGTASDVTWFIGAGGGIDILFGHHFALRNQVDVVWNHLFSDLLANGRWEIRYSVGPAFNFGKNIKQ